MYSPRIPERFIPLLYRLGRARGRPMTHLVADALERYLASEGVLTIEPPSEMHRPESSRIPRDRLAA